MAKASTIAHATPSQWRALRYAWIYQDALIVSEVTRSGGAYFRMLKRLRAYGWLGTTPYGRFGLTEKGRTIAATELARRPHPGDVLRLHLEDQGQDITHLDVEVSNRPWARIVDCPQYWVWGRYLATNSVQWISRWQPGMRVHLACDAERTNLKYLVERVEWRGLFKDITADFKPERLAAIAACGTAAAWTAAQEVAA
jgi:hypothetical protein